MRALIYTVAAIGIPLAVVLLTLLMSHDSSHVVVHEEDHTVPEYVILIHGGAGTLTAENTSPDRQEAYQYSLKQALQLGGAVLDAGGSAMDVVEQVITFLENDSLFNAGKGAVLNASGQPELDASIMDGAQLEAGAVAGVSHVCNPIQAARKVLENSPHVMLAGSGAELFCEAQGLTMVEPEYFMTSKMLNRYMERSAEMDKHGTVGCVVLDRSGDLAAGTSTGGMMMKKYGRIGDSPVIGAGTYADNESCAVSCTGHGEFFIRYAVAHEISSLMKHAGLSLEAAADSVIMGTLANVDGSGGVIALDSQGNYHFSFNTAGMLRGVMKAGEEPQVFLFAE